VNIFVNIFLRSRLYRFGARDQSRSSRDLIVRSSSESGAGTSENVYFFHMDAVVDSSAELARTGDVLFKRDRRNRFLP
jgi:hypothetical protein